MALDPKISIKVQFYKPFFRISTLISACMRMCEVTQNV